MGLNFLGEVGDKCDINPFSCLANGNVCEFLDTQRCFRTNPIQFLQDNICVRDKIDFLGLLKEMFLDNHRKDMMTVAGENK